MTYMIASTMPQARLQPIAPMSIVRTSSRPLVAADREPVKVRTMIRPKRISEYRSVGSRTLGVVSPWASSLSGLAAAQFGIR